MTSNTSRYFNTAKTIAITAILTLHHSSYAQKSNNTNCETVFKITPFTALLPSASKNIWFIPNANDVPNTKTLSIMSANRSELLHQGSRFLTKLPKGWDLQNPNSQLFYIVRSKTIRSKNLQRKLGRMMQVIGMAQLEKNPQATNDTNEQSEIMHSLKIIKSTAEVTKQDKLLPKPCLHINLNTITESSPKKTPTTKRAHVLAFLSEYYIGSKDSIILINKGSKSGIALKQTWSFLDELQNQPASAESFGSAQVLQVFEEMSILQITKTSHEVRLNTPLILLPKQ